jgi:hemoglobin
VALTAYERAGGFSSVRRIVSEFYERVLGSPVISHHFEDVAMPRLIEHQTRFISFLMGGPVPAYTDEHLQHVHAGFGITLGEFDEMVELLVETLEDFDIPADDRARIQRELRKRQPVIVTAGDGRASA